MTDKKETTLHEALLEIQQEPIIAKKTSEGYNYTYADLEAVWDACREAVNKAGVLVNQQVQVDAVKTTLNKGGDKISTNVPLLLPENATMQQLGSAITYARRYGLVTALGIITEDDDGDTASTPLASAVPAIRKDTPATDKQKKAILALVKQKGQIKDLEVVKTVAFEIYGDLNDLTVRQASDAIGELKDMTPEVFKMKADMDQDPLEPKEKEPF